MGWGATRQGKKIEIPDWVRQFLLYYERTCTLELITNEICQKLSDTKSI